MKIVDNDGNVTFVSQKSKEGQAEIAKRKAEVEKRKKVSEAKK